MNLISYMFFSGQNKTYKKGFTLVELTVSLGIMTLILTMVLSNQSQYTEGSTLVNLADEIGLTITQAQTYGVSVKEFSPGTSEFSAAYGVEFNITSSGSNDAYIFFADREVGSVTGVYESGWTCPTDASSECLTKTNIARNNKIATICSIPNSGPESCNVGKLDVTFVRPLTNANLEFFDLNGAYLSLSNIKGARIGLISPSGTTRSVTVYTTGQISIQ
ncbi:MAG: prepilin-type N-terminal cleavage/methylation domain-containing protein [bacterium]